MRKHFFSIVLLLFFTALSGCDKPIPAKYISEDKWATDYEVHYEYQTEVWNDPDVLSTPRIQFTWAKPGLDKYYTDVGIWSMRLDGSDLREVVSPEVIFNRPRLGGIRSRSAMPRSPNNRYIAVGLDKQNRIIDLETKEVIELSPAKYTSYFQWMPDSASLLYGTTEGVKQYYLETGEEEMIETRFRDDGLWQRWFLLKGGSVIAVEVWDEIFTYDFNSGELLDKRPGDFYAVDRQKLSADGKYYLRTDTSTGYWSTVDEPSVVIQKIPNFNRSGFVGMTLGQRVYSPYSGGNREGIEVVGGDLVKPNNYIFPNRKRVPDNLSFYNTGY